MSRYYSYLNSAIKIIEKYRGEEPFASFLKKYFAAEKKFGTRDRRQIAHLCYCYFRTYHLFKNDTTDERILKGLFLCSAGPDDILQQLKPEWNEKSNVNVEEKCSMLNEQCSVINLFPWNEELSEGIGLCEFSKSFLTQPDLFIRIRPDQRDSVLKKMQRANCKFISLSTDCVAIASSTKLDDIIDLNREAVIQDYSSQQTGEFLKSAILNSKSPVSLWDCCAGSGGKSIIAKDILGDIDLTVSDVRETILINLKKRFRQAGISNYKSFVTDLSKENFQFAIHNLQYSIIIADVPCSGSGTWTRTPERLSYFDEKEIEEYASLQKKILSNVIPQLKPGGYLLYITCSVFKKENEDNAAYIKDQLHLDLVKTDLLKGYEKKADTMFAALFQKSL